MTATLIFGDRVQDPDTTDRRVAHLAGALDTGGIGDGDVVAVMLRNDPVWVEAMLAVRRLGAYYAPINWHYGGDEAGYILGDSGAKVLVIHTDLLARIDGHVPEGVWIIVVPTPVEIVAAYGLPDAVGHPLPAGTTAYEAVLDGATAWAGPDRRPRGQMAYTSGTTGRPKGIRRQPATPEMAARAAEIFRIGLGIGPGVRTLVCAPIYHSAPNVQTLNAALVGELVVIEPRFDAARLLATVERHRLDHLYLAPIMFVRLLRLSAAERAAHDTGSLRFVVSTGAPVSPEIKGRMIAWWGPIVHELYAGSEAGLVAFARAQDWLDRPGTVGRLLPHVSVRVLDDEGQPVEAGRVGTLYIRQDAWPAWTYNNRAAERAQVEIDGHITMGDMGYFDADGYLYISDRKRDMVISGGVNIYPAEIEMVLITMPGVQDCAVFGIPDAEYGEALAAVVQPLPGAAIDADGVRAFLRARIAGFKVPGVVEFRDALPREDSGKIFKRKLRDPYWAGIDRRI